MKTSMLQPAALALGLALTSTWLAAPAEAQIRQPGLPAGFWSELDQDLQTLRLSPLDHEALIAQDRNAPKGPLRYGTLRDLDLDLVASGRWDVALDGSLVLRKKIQSPGAFTVGLEFSQFHLPPGGKMFLYDPRRVDMLGAYTPENHREDGGFVIEPFPGDTVIVEVLLAPETTGDLRLVVSNLIHDYRDVRKLLVNEGGGEGSCLIDVNCSQGSNWAVQKRATVRTLSGGGLCSGALINNTANDGTRYLLTADHCGQSSNTVFSFNYQTSGCGTGSAPSNQTVSGATLLVTNGTVDSRLMRITSNIPASYGPAFAGWTRSTSNTNFAFALGHPSGGPKKIAIDGNGTFRETNFWRVSWSEGTLEGGSSGGPLFDSQGRIRGPACCVSSFTCTGQTAYFGRFDRFWSQSSLAQWLDPLGLNPTTLDAYDPGGGGPSTPPPTLTSIAPFFVLAVAADAPYKVTLNGSGLSTVTQVRVDGIQLTTLPQQYTILSDSQIEISVPRVSKIGPVTVEVTSPTGTAQNLLTVFPNPDPILDLSNSVPEFLLKVLGATVTMGGNGGDTMLLFASLSNQPSSLPGILEAGIGNNFAELIYIGPFVVDPVKAWTSVNLPLTGLPPGTVLHFQAGKLGASLPLVMTNVQTGSILF